MERNKKGIFQPLAASDTVLLLPIQIWMPEIPPRRFQKPSVAYRPFGLMARVGINRRLDAQHAGLLGLYEPDGYWGISTGVH